VRRIDRLFPRLSDQALPVIRARQIGNKGSTIVVMEAADMYGRWHPLAQYRERGGRLYDRTRSYARLKVVRAVEKAKTLLRRPLRNIARVNAGRTRRRSSRATATRGPPSGSSDDGESNPADGPALQLDLDTFAYGRAT